MFVLPFMVNKDVFKTELYF